LSEEDGEQGEGETKESKESEENGGYLGNSFGEQRKE
jgi:hypothetical protein